MNGISFAALSDQIRFQNNFVISCAENITIHSKRKLNVFATEFNSKKKLANIEPVTVRSKT